MERAVIQLTTQEQLKIFMDPLRQRLLRTLSALGEPATAKQLADRLGITPSSAKHHLTRLESIGLVALHHTRQIRGITASYYQLSPVTVRLGLEKGAYADQRQLLAESLLMGVFQGVQQYMEYYRQLENPPEKCPAELTTGVVHLTPHHALALRELIQTFVESHETAGPDTIPYEYALMAYPVERQP